MLGRLRCGHWYRLPNINNLVNVASLTATESHGSMASIPLNYRRIGIACGGALIFCTKRSGPIEEPPGG